MAKRKKKSQTPPEQATKELGTRLATGARAVGTTMVPEALHMRNSNEFSTVERPYLVEYEAVYRNDPYIHWGVNFIVRSMLASLGPYLHKNKTYQAFIQDMFHEMEGNLHQYVGELLTSALWSGFSVSEKVFEAKKNRVVLKKLINFHPGSLHVAPDKQGELTDGKEKPAHPFLPKTGIWQRLQATYAYNETAKKLRAKPKDVHNEYIRLPLNKLVVLAHNARHGNLTGESILAPVMQRYEMAIETLRNLMITSERYGSPQVAVIVPRSTTSEVIDLGNGQQTYKSLAQKAAESMAQLSNSNGLVIEEPTGIPDAKVRLQNISSFNNFGESFLNTIDHMYKDIMVGLGVPPLLIMEHSGGLSAGAIAKVHAETYKQFLVSLYKEFIEPFTEQVIGQLLWWNFGETDPGQFAFNPFDIAAADTLMSVFEKATAVGVLDPSQPEDLQWIRTSLGIPPASAETLDERVKLNKELMQRKRVPDTDRVKIAKLQHLATAENVEAANKTQVKVAKIQQETQLAQQETQKSIEKAKLKVAKEKPAMPPPVPATPAKPAAKKPAPKKAA